MYKHGGTMDKVKKLFLSKNESNSKVNLIIILLSITLFLIIGAASIGFSETSSTESSDLKDFIAGVTITDNEGNSIDDGTLYVGEKYNIQLQFKEEGAQGLQFTPDNENKLKYQIPSNFNVDPVVSRELKVKIGEEEKIIGTYSIDENGLLTIDVTDEGRTTLESSKDISLLFDITVTAQSNKSGDDGKVNFGDVGKEFNFHVSDEAKIKVEKTGSYKEDELDKDGIAHSGTLSYTIKTTIEHGKVKDATITDSLTLPNNKSFKFTLQKSGDKLDVTVKLKRMVNDEEIEYTLSEEDYDIEEADNHTFKLKFKDSSNYNPLLEGDIVEVTYNYHVDYIENSGDLLWDTVENNVTVKGIVTPENQEEPETEIEEKATNRTDIAVTSPERGVVIKDFDYDPQTKKVHYTLYTIIPKGKWEPLYIYDDISVNHNGKKYYMHEFKENGRVSNLTVKAKDIDEWFKWDKNTIKEEKVKDLKKYIEGSTPLNKFNFDNKDDAYNSESIENYIYKYADQSLFIIFGLTKDERDDGHWYQWGHWDHNKDRLIVTEYDLDMSDGEIELTEMSDNNNKIKMSVEDILLEGIYNNISLRFGSYNPVDTVYFNTIPKMQKNGVKDESNNTIEYTVSLNATDNTVVKYLESVKEEYIRRGTEEHDWNFESGLKDVFYDKIPEGWEYVEGSLYATTVDKWENKHIFDDISSMKKPTRGPTDENGDIYAPLVYFKTTDGTNLEIFNTFNESLASLSFTYKIKATKEWINAHGESDTPTDVVNHAEIKNEKTKYWEVESIIPFMPSRINKIAEQDGSTNLMHFTLEINPGGVDLDKDNDYLQVTDKSEGIQITINTIKVIDKDGKELKSRGHITLNDKLEENEWGLLSSDDDSSQFRLKIPDNKALEIKYDALIEDLGEVTISNKASIEGIVASDTSYEGSLQVNNIYGIGEGSTYELTFEKVDKDYSEKKLEGAKFEFYIVIADESKLEKTDEITIGDKTYNCFKEKNWEFTTDEHGQFKVEKEMDWDLDLNNYYIIKEVEAPEGYMPLEEPILFFYGMKSQLDTKNYPTAKLVLPNDKLTIENEPVPYKIPVTGGKGLKIFYVLGFLLTIISISFILNRRVKFNK